MRQNLDSTIATILATLLCASSSSAAIVFNNGTPDAFFFGEEMTYLVEAEPFTLAATTSITGANFWTHEQPGGWDGTLEYLFFADVGGTPALTPLARGFGQNVVKTFTRDDPFGIFPFQEYSYSFNLESPVAVPAGTQMWFALHLADDYTSRDEVYWSNTSRRRVPNGFDSFEISAGVFDTWEEAFTGNAFNLVDDPLSAGTVPEPSTVAVWSLLGLNMMAFGRRWRRQRSI